MTVELSTDYAYFRSVLERRGVWRAVSGGFDHPLDATIALAVPNTLFFIAQDGARRMGFVAFRCVTSNVAECHACLLTFGRETLLIGRDVFSRMRALGFDTIIAAFPSSNKAAAAAARVLGFKESTHVQGMYPECADKSYLFLQLDNGL